MQPQNCDFNSYIYIYILAQRANATVSVVENIAVIVNAFDK